MSRYAKRYDKKGANRRFRTVRQQGCTCVRPACFSAVCCGGILRSRCSACRNGPAVEGVFGGCRNVSAAGVQMPGKTGRCGRNFRSGTIFAHDIILCIYICRRKANNDLTLESYEACNCHGAGGCWLWRRVSKGTLCSGRGAARFAFSGRQRERLMINAVFEDIGFHFRESCADQDA